MKTLKHTRIQSKVPKLRKLHYVNTVNKYYAKTNASNLREIQKSNTVNTIRKFLKE